MFIGQFEHSIDEKHRVAIPSKFRKEFKDGAIITKGLDGCLFMFPAKKFKEMAQNIGELPLTKSSARLYARIVLASANEADFDSQGRIVLPGYLKKFGQLNKTAVVIGLYDRVEIWAKEVWDKETGKSDKKAERLIEDLSELGM